MKYIQKDTGKVISIYFYFMCTYFINTFYKLYVIYMNKRKSDKEHIHEKHLGNFN